MIISKKNMRYCFLFLLVFCKATFASNLVDINMNKAIEISDLVEKVQSWTKKNVILDRNTRGKIQIIAPHKVTPSQAYQIFLSSLDMLGLSTIETRYFIKIISKTKGLNQLPGLSFKKNIPYTDKVLTQIYPLSYISANKARKILSTLVFRTSIKIFPKINALIVSDTGNNLNRVKSLLKLLDVQSSEFAVRIIPIKNSGASEIVKTIKSLLGNNIRGKNTNLKVLADERTNSVVVAGGSDKELDGMEAMIAKLDIPLPKKEEYQSLFVRPILYSSVKKIAKTINSARSGINNKRDNLVIVADEYSNNLVISGTYDAYKRVGSVIRKLDRRLPQIFFDINLVELNDNDAIKVIPSLLAGSVSSDGTGSKAIIGYDAQKMFSFANTSNSVESTVPPHAISSLSQDLSVGVFTSKTVKIDGLGEISPGGILTVLKSQQGAKTLSSPQIFSIINEEASFQAGETVYVPQTKRKGGIISQELRKEDVDLEVKITAKLSSSDYLSLKLDIDAKRILNLLADGTPLIGKKKSRQFVSLNNGQTILISGIRNISRIKNQTSVPFFDKIPLIGVFFRNLNEIKRVSHLMIFITPHVIHGAQDLRSLYTKKKSEFEFLNSRKINNSRIKF